MNWERYMSLFRIEFDFAAFCLSLLFICLCFSIFLVWNFGISLPFSLSFLFFLSGLIEQFDSNIWGEVVPLNKLPTRYGILFGKGQRTNPKNLNFFWSLHKSPNVENVHVVAFSADSKISICLDRCIQLISFRVVFCLFVKYVNFH